MIAKPRLKALRKIVKQVIDAKTRKTKQKALDEFDNINDDGWHTCAVGSFLNDCGINVSQVARCKESGLGSVVTDLVEPEIKEEGSKFESNVRSKNKSYQLNALRFVDKLIRAKPCSILKV